MEDWTQTLGAGPLLGIAAVAVALILFLVIKLRLHAFLVLIVVSLLTALATGLPMDVLVQDVLVANSEAHLEVLRDKMAALRDEGT